MRSRAVARRRCAAVCIQACVRGYLLRRARPLSLVKHERRNEILKEAAAIAKQVATFKTDPCPYGDHPSSEQARCCPFYHGDRARDRRRPDFIFASSQARFKTEFERLTSAHHYKTAVCRGKCEGRFKRGGICPFYHSEREKLPKNNEGFMSLAAFEMHVAQNLLLNANLFDVDQVCCEPCHEAPVEVKDAKDAKDAKERPEKERHECIICLEARPEVVLIDCGHLQVCQACSKLLDSCPTCRTPITTKPVKIFR